VCLSGEKAEELDYHGWECNYVYVIEVQMPSVLEVRGGGSATVIYVIVEVVISVYTVHIVDKISRQKSKGAD
jgi:hypothetical protein